MAPPPADDTPPAEGRADSAGDSGAGEGGTPPGPEDRETARGSEDGQSDDGGQSSDDSVEASDGRGSADGVEAGDEQHDDEEADAGDERETDDGETATRAAGNETDEGPAGAADPAQARAALLDALADPAGATQRLPYVLTQLESDEQPVRLLAATACCLIAVEADDERVVEYLIRRLSDRLTDEEVSLELTAALDYLSSSFPGQVEPILAELAADRSEVPLPRVGNFTRSYYYGTELSRAGVGRMRVAGTDAPEDPSQVIADADREERERIARERRRRERGEADADPADDGDAAAGGADGGQGDAEADGSLAGRPDPTVRRTGEVSSIAVRSRFDELHVQGERHSGRYATTYEALVGEGGEQRAVALRLLDQPEEVRPQFDRELAEQLGGWETASDHDNVVTVFDWGVESQPWVATALVGGVLAGRDRPSPAVAFRNALALADAVSHLHGNDVVHGGLDSRTVVYPGERFDDEDAERGPLLNNVGLVTVFRHYFNPADCLDPRYAAPEYYDDRFGRVDHATDIYQLGAVYYRLFTGRPPFTGEFDAVRRAVLSKSPPAPSAVVEDLPAALDEVLAKTMAKQKLRRYETVQQLRGELAGLAEAYE